jgi:Protein of unknown function (DUF3179).
MSREPGQSPRRRSLLGGLGALAVTGLAGCVQLPSAGDGDGGDGGDAGATDVTDGLPGSTASGAVVGEPPDEELPVGPAALTRGAPKDGIPAIVNPSFGADWSGFEAETRSRFGSGNTIAPRLADDDLVVGVARDGEARAYPLKLLNYHEIVNDTFDGPLLVTYCPLCRSAIVAKRRAGGEPTVFGVSGLLYRNALVMYDEATGSNWSQILAQAITGELTGERLELLPSTLATFGEWRASHPDTTVLRPPPESDTLGAGTGVRDYATNPYPGYDQSDQIGIGGEFDDDRLGPKTKVVGVAVAETARAYTAEAIETEGPIKDTVGGLPIVVTNTPNGTPIAWSRRVGDETLSLGIADERHLAGGGSRWRRDTGVAVDGPFEGERLAQANSVSALFWFAWLDFYPETELYAP